MKKFDIMSGIGIVLGATLVTLSIVFVGDLRAFWNPSGIMITVGGSFGALMVNFRLDEMKSVLQVTRKVFVRQDDSIIDLHTRFVQLAQKARREGLLVLEDELDQIDDQFLRNGLQMVIDGFEPDNIRNILDAELSSLEGRHELGQSLYRAWGNFAPAFGMIGTLIGLVMMLAKLDDPSAIGPGMAVALLTTLYGSLLANLIFLPMAGKLAIYSNEEIRLKEIIVEALLALQSGINPRLLQEQIKSYFSPAEKKLLEEANKRSDEGDEVEDMLINV
ncbi:MAG: MotA/TolQ/ExbB proton channel family protein [Dethiobacteria bacterium]|nr:MotA/TolQ/ExbB proton channel family protein [Dethiobacteria bacterium]